MPRLAEQIEGSLSAGGGKAAAGPAPLGSSEVIESVFGSYKQYVERGGWSAIGSHVLLLPALLVTATTDLLWRALRAVRGPEVRAWCQAHLGKSRHQRFRQGFGKTKTPQAQPAGGRASAGETVNGPPPTESESAGQPPPAEAGGADRPPPAGKVAA